MLSQLALKNEPHLIKLLATYKFKGSYHLLFPYAKLNLRLYWRLNPAPNWERTRALWFLEQLLGLASALHVIHDFRTVQSKESDESDDQVFRGRSSTAGRRAIDREEKFGRHGDLKPEKILWFDDLDPTGILQIAGFGLSRFHRLESRSRVDPHTVGASPTYAGPELVLGRSVSRAYDIWCFGCVFLEFITWILDGNTALEKFADARLAARNFDGVHDDTFYTLHNSDTGKSCTVRPEVTNWIQRLRSHEHCSGMIRDLLGLVEDEMLQVRSEDRVRSGELKERLKSMVTKCRLNVEYLLGD